VREIERVRKVSKREEVKRKTFGGKREVLYMWGKKEHIRRYPGNARSAF
jgi:hypothetical protein